MQCWKRRPGCARPFAGPSTDKLAVIGDVRSPILDVALNFFEYFVESGFAPDACRGVRLRALYSGVRRRRHGLLFDLPEQLVDFLVGEFWVPSLHRHHASPLVIASEQGIRKFG